MAEKLITPLNPENIAEKIEEGMTLRVTHFAIGFTNAKFYYVIEAPGHWKIFRGLGRQMNAQGYLKIIQTLPDGSTEVELKATEPQAFGGLSIYVLIVILAIMVFGILNQTLQGGGLESSPLMPLAALGMLVAVGIYAYTFYAGQKALRAFMIELLQLKNGGAIQ